MPESISRHGCRLSLKAEELLKQHGYECCICPVFDDPSGSVILAGIKTERLADVAADCSLIIVVGGDGTILSAARQLRECSVPILGINLGSKGFMATLEPNELDYILDAAHGEYRLSRRMKIDVSLVRGGGDDLHRLRAQRRRHPRLRGLHQAYRAVRRCGYNRVLRRWDNTLHAHWVDRVLHVGWRADS